MEHVIAGRFYVKTDHSADDHVSMVEPIGSLLKFGHHAVLGTAYATVMTLAGSEVHETYVSTNIITHISSDSTGDTDQTISVGGFTIADGDLTRVTQTVDLAGQTKTALGTPLVRVERAFVSAGSTLAGDVYIYEDVAVTTGAPDTDSACHLIVPASDGQSLKCALSTSSDEGLFITGVSSSVNKKIATNVEFRLQKRSLTGVWRTQYIWTADTSGSSTVGLDFTPHLYIDPNSDIRVIAESGAIATPVSAQIHGIYSTLQ